MTRTIDRSRERRRLALPLVAALIAALGASPSPARAITVDGGLVAPVPVSPTPYAAVAAPILEWRAVPGAVRYRVDLQPVPPTLSGICGGETELIRMTCDWIPPGPYTWTVRAIGPGNRLGPPSAQRAFTRIPRPLGTPSILAPANGTTFTYPDGIGVLRWSAVPDAAYYQVQYSDSAAFPGEQPPISSGLTTEGIVAPVDVLGPTRYWRVRAVSHSQAEAGPWSAVRSFTVRWPTAPTLVSPADGAVVTSARLDWEPLAGASRYGIQVALPDDPGFTDPITVTETSATDIDWGEGPASSFLWRIRGLNGAGATTAWSAARTVTIDPAGDPAPAGPPLSLGAPALGGPADGATNVDPVATPLRWSAVPGTIGYDVEVRPAGAGWVISDGSGPTYPWPATVANLDFGTTYQWRVRANATSNVFVAGPWSETRTFSTRPRGTVALTAPANGASVSYEDLLFTWTALPASPIYLVELSQTSDFASPVTLEAYRDPRAVPRTTIPPGTWHWRVRAGRDSTQAISAVRTVVVIDDVPPAGIVGPDNRSTSSDTISVGSPAEDAVSEIDRYAVSANGTVWEDWEYLDAQDWSLTSPGHGGPDPGLRTLWFRWRDTAGNWSTARTQRVWYGPVPADTAPPIVTGPRVTGIVPASSIPASGTIPIRLAWTGSDEFSNVSYELTRRTDGVGGEQTVLTGYVDRTTVDLDVPAQHAYRFTARGTDQALNVSGYAAGPTYTVSRYGDVSSSISYKGSWASSSSSSFWGGTARRSMTAGSTATFKFTGRSVGLVALRASNRGAATIYVNGTKVATIDLYSREYLGRQIVWSMDWSTSATRTVTVRVAGTAGRPRVDIDGFVVVR